MFSSSFLRRTEGKQKELHATATLDGKKSRDLKKYIEKDREREKGRAVDAFETQEGTAHSEEADCAKRHTPEKNTHTPSSALNHRIMMKRKEKKKWESSSRRKIERGRETPPFSLLWIRLWECNEKERKCARLPSSSSRLFVFVSCCSFHTMSSHRCQQLNEAEKRRRRWRQQESDTCGCRIIMACPTREKRRGQLLEVLYTCEKEEKEKKYTQIIGFCLFVLGDGSGVRWVRLCNYP